MAIVESAYFGLANMTNAMEQSAASAQGLVNAISSMIARGLDAAAIVIRVNTILKASKAQDSKKTKDFGDALTSLKEDDCPPAGDIIDALENLRQQLLSAEITRKKLGDTDRAVIASSGAGGGKPTPLY